MQDDRRLTFRDIHGSSEALVAAVKEVERIALVKTNETSLLRLRFLIPYLHGGSSCDFVLTPPRDYGVSDFVMASDEYLAVSYVWTHKQPTYGIQIPNYHIWDGTDLKKPPRPLRCPPFVFHRAVQFARSQTIQRIWIDQECIDQEAPSDVERYLQDMHRIYRFSRSTAVVLSNVIHDEWTAARCFTLGWAGDEQDFEALRLLVRDPWFTRSWTFHEQQCAIDVVYLLPIPPSSRSRHAEATPRWAFRIDALIEDAVWFYGGPDGGKKMKWWNQTLKSYFSKHNHFGWSMGSVPDTIESVYKMMKDRHNRVLSDRIQILANICELEWKLKTTLLNCPTQSFSTCLLALVMANTWPDPVARARQYREWGDSLVGKDIGTAISELSDAHGTTVLYLRS